MIDKMDNNIGGRIARIMEYNGQDQQTSFAELMGWSKQYLHKLLKNEAVGLSVVLAIVEKFPEIDARWLLTGEGNMVKLDLARILRSWLDLEKFIPVMNERERRELVAGTISWTRADLERWSSALDASQAELNRRYSEALNKQKSATICK